MKLSILLCALLVLTSVSFAQKAETFDIVTFTPPVGWKKEAKDGVVLFVTLDKKKGTFCILAVYRSGESSGDARRDFDKDWQELILGQVGSTDKPEIETGKTPGGWETVTGAATFTGEAGPSIVLLNTFSGFGRSVSFSGIFNDPDYLQTIESFITSMTLLRPPVETSPSPAAQPSRLTQFFWKQSQNRKDIGGYAGYSRNTYQFNANGTYEFSRVDFQNYAPKYYLEKEEGTYTIAGSKITITPRKAIFSSHKSTKEDPPLKSGSLGLAAVQYSFEFMDLHNNGRWSLLLSPVDGIETKRDGGFSFMLNGERRKTYSYSAVNAAGELVP